MILLKRLLILISFFAIYGCIDDQKTTFSEINISADANSLVEANIPTAVGDTLITNSINKEINLAVMSALQIGDSNRVLTKSIDESIALFNKEYAAFKKDFPESAMPWEAQIDGEILFESSKIISLSITAYVNTGGAHGNTTIKLLNFDAETGKRLYHEDLIKDSEKFESIVKPYFKEALKNEEILFDQDGFLLPENMGYTKDGLVLLYNTYEIAAYSMGIIEFKIPFDKVNSYLVFNGSK